MDTSPYQVLTRLITRVSSSGILVCYLSKAPRKLEATATLESRENPRSSPTTIYLPGGPGESFLDGSSGFPCDVNEYANDTTLNQWSWNNDVNMLYLDIPVQTGFSYTKSQNGTFDLLTNTFTPASPGTESVATNLTSVVATLSSQESQDTVNTTSQVAIQTWQIAQAWFQEFPEHKTDNDETNFWTYSVF